MASSPTTTYPSTSTTNTFLFPWRTSKIAIANGPKSPRFPWVTSPRGPLNANPPSPLPPRSVPPTIDVEKRSSLSASVKRYSLISKRTKIVFGVVIACILILIIGLAAGLSARNKSQNLPLPSDNGGPYQGELTYYAPGLGACGIESRDGDDIVSLSHTLFDAVSTSANPNLNPLCGKMVRARRGEITVDLKVVDRCTGCQPRDLDITEKTFAKLARVEQGRVDVEWSWLEGVPDAAS